MEEATTRCCAYCKSHKDWIWNGDRLKDGSKVYIDKENRKWAGRRCPQCEKERVQKAIKCDRFNRRLIINELEQKGFRITSSSLPLIAEKDGKSMRIGVKRASTSNGKITIESNTTEDVDMVALVFESVRICPIEQWEKIQESVKLYQKEP
jgi:4-hydroxy-3-methylbut-2-en-1-yl diphosphate synthase IspG/GcpE